MRGPDPKDIEMTGYDGKVKIEIKDKVSQDHRSKVR